MGPPGKKNEVNAESLELLIRKRGPVLDMPFVQSVYKPLLENQPRGGVSITRDVAYGDDPRQQFDLYRPEQAEHAPLPVIVFVPGGGFIRGDKSEKENVGLHFARHGMVVLVANYRLAPGHQWPSGAEDVVAVYEWVMGNADQFSIDPKRIFLVGESAGAAHVATATLLRRFHPAGGLTVAGTVLISGVYNPVLEKLARDQFGVATPDPRNEAYYGSDFDSYKDKSTVALIDTPPSAPLLITFAELDLLQMQVQAGELFARLVMQHGCQPRMCVIRGHNHLTQTFAVNTGDESLTAPVLEFIQSC